jgi:hypothetical protein
MGGEKIAQNKKHTKKQVKIGHLYVYQRRNREETKKKHISDSSNKSGIYQLKCNGLLLKYVCQTGRNF